MKTFEVDLSYEDLIRFTTTVKVKAKSKEDLNKKWNSIEYQQKIVDKSGINWEEDSIGDGFDIELDEIREVKND